MCFDDDSSRVFMQESHPVWQQGSHVKLVICASRRLPYRPM